MINWVLMVLRAPRIPVCHGLHPQFHHSSFKRIFSTGARGQVVCPSVTRQRRGQTPQRRGLCSSRGRTRVQEPSSGPTQPTRFLRSDLGSWTLAEQQKKQLYRFFFFFPTSNCRPVIFFPGNFPAELSKPVRQQLYICFYITCLLVASPFTNKCKKWTFFLCGLMLQ